MTDTGRHGGADAGARITVAIPCFNEAATVARVVSEFRAALPDAAIVVYGNASTDGTAELAGAAGAEVRHEHRKGKGWVVQRMLRESDADVLVMVDGDGTYPAAAAPALIAPVLRGEADMVVGSRLHRGSASEFRAVNRFGNRLFRAVLNALFGVRLTDVLSGYRAFSRRLTDTLPLASGGFEIETELTIKALQRGLTVVEVPVDLVSRPEGSRSKIRIVQDGILIGGTILALFRDYKPLTFFGGAGLAVVALGLVPGGLLAARLAAGHPVSVPLAVLASALVLAGVVLGAAGLVVHTVTRRFQELESLLARRRLSGAIRWNR